jgi:type V secretory pathway adhesin AidA
LKRVAAGAPGSHAISGSWKAEKVSNFSDVGATVTYKMTGDGLQMSWNGQSYDAKFDGKQYLTANDPGKTWVSLKRISNNTIEETDTRDGHAVEVYKMTVSADGKTMAVVDKDIRRGTTTRYEMLKQP